MRLVAVGGDVKIGGRYFSKNLFGYVVELVVGSVGQYCYFVGNWCWGMAMTLELLSIMRQLLSLRPAVFDICNVDYE